MININENMKKNLVRFFSGKSRLSLNNMREWNKIINFILHHVIMLHVLNANKEGTKGTFSVLLNKSKWVYTARKVVLYWISFYDHANK